MRIFKYWIEYSKILTIEDIQQPSKVFGGSNISIEDAERDAKIKLEKAQKIINGELGKDESYEADIVEEIIHEIDKNNIVTRNRYGALVLNSKKLMFIDIDNASKKSFWDKIFNRKLTHKELLLKQISKTMKKAKYADLGFRVYETFKGFRVMVSGKNFSPRSDESIKMMQDFSADALYRWLCIKQNCYRARLTPKPYRIKQKRIKVIFPDRTEAEQEKMENWVRAYDEISNNFATCKLVLEQGRSYSNRVIDYHDRHSKINTNLNLA